MRRTVLPAALVIFLLLLVSGVADAATLYTQAVMVDATAYTRCHLTNVGTVPYVVTIEALDGHGGVEDSAVGITLDPGESHTNVWGHAAVNVCKFTVPVPSRVRAGVCLMLIGTGNCFDNSPAR
jgi:hypothetical protein